MPIRRSGPTGRSSAITTIWSHRTLKCHYNDLVPTDAQVQLRRSGPTGRSSAITTIWSHRTLKCHYDDLVPPDAQMQLRRSGPTGRSSAITTIWSTGRSNAITTIWSHWTLKCNYDDLVPPDAQVSLRRSSPNERTRTIATSEFLNLLGCSKTTSLFIVFFIKIALSCPDVHSPALNIIEPASAQVSSRRSRSSELVQPDAQVPLRRSGRT